MHPVPWAPTPAWFLQWVSAAARPRDKGSSHLNWARGACKLGSQVPLMVITMTLHVPNSRGA